MSIITDVEKEDYEPHILFSELKPSPDKRYVIHILNVKHERPSKLTKKRTEGKVGAKYVMYRVRLEEGFDDLYLNRNTVYRFHFPETALKIAWRRTRDGNKKELDGVYDCKLTFMRETKQKLVIIKKEYLKAI